MGKAGIDATMRARPCGRLRLLWFRGQIPTTECIAECHSTIAHRKRSNRRSPDPLPGTTTDVDHSSTRRRRGALRQRSVLGRSHPVIDVPRVAGRPERGRYIALLPRRTCLISASLS